MDDLHKQHRQEQRDLQSRITQKKKSATKKTRKGINDECAELERQLKEKQDAELSSIDVGGSNHGKIGQDGLSVQNDEKNDESLADNVEETVKGLPANGANNDQGQSKKPSRQKVRLARRAAEQEEAIARAENEATHLPNLKDQERKVMLKELKARGLVEKDIRSDGHCLYAAVADQLSHYGVDLAPVNGSVAQPGYKVTRNVAADFISHHPDDFSAFLEEPLDEYVRKIRGTGEWGGQLELSALARAYGVDINVLQGDGRVENIQGGSEVTRKVLWLAYYRHSFGLGEHYNSLRVVP